MNAQHVSLASAFVACRARPLLFPLACRDALAAWRNKLQPHAVEGRDTVLLAFGADRSHCVAREGGVSSYGLSYGFQDVIWENQTRHLPVQPGWGAPCGIKSSAVIGRHPPRDRIFEAVRLQVV